MIDIRIVTSQVVFSMMDMFTIPNGKLKGYVNRRLMGCVAETLTNNLKDIPVIFTNETDIDTGNEIYEMRFNLISNEEIKRLRKMEIELFELKSRMQDDHICIGPLPF